MTSNQNFDPNLNDVILLDVSNEPASKQTVQNHYSIQRAQLASHRFFTQPEVSIEKIVKNCQPTINNPSPVALGKTSNEAKSTVTSRESEIRKKSIETGICLIRRIEALVKENFLLKQENQRLKEQHAIESNDKIAKITVLEERILMLEFNSFNANVSPSTSQSLKRVSRPSL